LQAKEYLKQAYWKNEEIKDKQAILEDLKKSSVSMGAIDYSKDKIQGGSGNKAPYENQVIKAVDLEREIAKDILELIQLKQEIINTIKAVPDETCSVLLMKRYGLGKSLKRIEKEMNYSLSHIKRLHQKALRMVVVPENRMMIPNDTFMCDNMIK